MLQKFQPTKFLACYAATFCSHNRIFSWKGYVIRGCSRSRSVLTSPWPAPEFLVQQFLCNYSSQTRSSPTLSSKRPYRGCKSLKANRSLPWQMPRRLVHGCKIIILLIMQACSRCKVQLCNIKGHTARSYLKAVWCTQCVGLHTYSMKYSVARVTTSLFYHFCAV